MALRQQPRPRLSPLADEPSSPAERLATIRTLVTEGADPAQLHRAYVLAWRLTWDYFDADTATEAMALRNHAGARLGPRRALAALGEARATARSA
jgi:hypothetical protein